jgi:hypothetical protein
MTFFRAIVRGLGIFLLLAAVVIAFVHVAEPIPGEHCLAIRVTSTGQSVPACPDTRYVRHVGIAIGMAVVALGLIAPGGYSTYGAAGEAPRYARSTMRAVRRTLGTRS